MSLYGDVVIKAEDAILNATAQAQELGLSAVGSMAKASDGMIGGAYTTSGGDELAAMSVELGGAYFGAIIQIQDITIATLSQLTATASEFAPDLSRLPVTNWLPTPAEFVQSTLGFTKALVESQKNYVARLRDVVVRGSTVEPKEPPRKNLDTKPPTTMASASTS
jgi:hypothetical protein